VLELARDRFWKTGYAGTRMDEIAEASGLGKGSLYGAFGSKSEDAFTRLSAYVQLVATDTAADTEHRGCLLAKGTAELAQHDPTVAARSAEAMRALLALLQSELAAAQRNRDIDDTADPERLAALLLTVLRGMEAVGKAGMDAQTLQGLADTALAVLPRATAGQDRPTVTSEDPAEKG
jgi:TetR/AcrR family transcriptional repressor of nem operon